ncbi:helix-turn-helix domain-containing protein [Spirosoma luteum]|uniref:helix-turn-helix domain-containing protein n=1 Tax=Spirosoma luteum TaxID=431553 RepID=UPI000475CC89|nr:AraC family transcriptional regulator [Spirosoma luteum]
MTMNSKETTRLRIRGMVCARCIDVVRDELSRLGLEVTEADLGQVTLRNPVDANALTRIDEVLAHQGFSIIDDHKLTIHQRARLFVDTYFGQTDLSESRTRLSAQLQADLGLEYDTISSQFAKAEGTTLEKYIISKRIDKVKEWLVYSDNTLTDIAYRTGYSSVQHLSNQFRQVTGLTPSYFRQVRQQKLALQQQAAT